MPLVWIPSLLRDLTGGQEQVRVQGRTVAEVINHLDAHFPGIRRKLCDEKGLRPGIAVAVDANIARFGLLQQVQDESEVHFLPAVGGGTAHASQVVK
jgi:molybdopterin synthase sulfur carrier subunit